VWGERGVRVSGEGRSTCWKKKRGGTLVHQKKKLTEKKKKFKKMDGTPCVSGRSQDAFFGEEAKGGLNMGGDVSRKKGKPSIS